MIVFLGETELQQKTLALRDLRTRNQESIPRAQAADRLRSFFPK